MGKKIAMVGCGMMAQALGFDLGRFSPIDEIVLLDNHKERLENTRKNLKKLWISERIKGPKLDTVFLDAVEAKNRMDSIFRGTELVVSACPYYLNYSIAEAAVEAGTNYVDLGGHLETSLKIQGLSKAARKKRLVLMPDVGLAPGIGNAIAGWGFQNLNHVDSVNIYCGGLPRNKNLPLGYRIAYSPQGLLGMYYGDSVVIRRSKRISIKTLTEYEKIKFPALGELEACIVGGATPALWDLPGKVKEFSYKTLRYPGHFEKFAFLRDIGLASEQSVAVNGVNVIPRKLLAEVLGKALLKPDEKDLVAFQTILEGRKNGKNKKVVFTCLDYGDPKRGFSALAKMTGFAAGSVCQLILQRKGIFLQPYGYLTPECNIDGDVYLKELDKRNIKLKVTGK
ncbi:saccharopine dehydrogenase C-terminal domain-containing protein [Elusimicrobiota bacterium]